MKQRGFIEFIVAVVATITLVGLIFLPVVWLDYAACTSKAEAMKMRVTWGPIKGCIVEYKPDKWIPLDRYRALDE